MQHAEELQGIDPVAFCREVEVPVSYAAEVRKMLNLARLLREQHVGLVSAG